MNRKTFHKTKTKKIQKETGRGWKSIAVVKLSIIFHPHRAREPSQPEKIKCFFFFSSWKFFTKKNKIKINNKKKALERTGYITTQYGHETKYRPTVE